MKALIMLALLLAMTGCSAGLSHRESPGDFGNFVNSLYENQNPQNPGDDGRGTLRLPAKVVVAQMGEVAPRERVLEYLQTERTLFTSVQAMPGNVIEHPIHNETVDAARQRQQRQIERMRRVATDLGGDYLYVYGGTIDHDTNSNPFSVLDLTIVGAWVAPGKNVRAEAKASGALVDVRSGRVMVLSTAEARKKTLASTASADDAETRLLFKLRDEVVDELTRRMVTQVKQQAGIATTVTPAGSFFH